MEDKKKEIDDLIQKLDKMLKERSKNEETSKIVKRLEQLLKEYLSK